MWRNRWRCFLIGSLFKRCTSLLCDEQNSKLTLLQCWRQHCSEFLLSNYVFYYVKKNQQAKNNSHQESNRILQCSSARVHAGPRSIAVPSFKINPSSCPFLFNHPAPGAKKQNKKPSKSLTESPEAAPGGIRWRIKAVRRRTFALCAHQFAGFLTKSVLLFLFN